MVRPRRYTSIPFLWFNNLCPIFFPETKRQSDQGVCPAFDGSSGIDGEDIINIPQVGYGTFQLFPDQNSYGPDDPSLSPFNNTVQQGLSWIQSQANVAQL